MEGPTDQGHLIDKVPTEEVSQIDLIKVKIVQEAITEAEFLFALDLKIEQVGKIDLECQPGQQVVQTVQTIIVQGFLLE